MLPEDRLDDVVWIEPGSSEHDKTVGLNFLEVPDCETEEERENGSRIASRTPKRSSIRTSTGDQHGVDHRVDGPGNDAVRPAVLGDRYVLHAVAR